MRREAVITAARRTAFGWGKQGIRQDLVYRYTMQVRRAILADAEVARAVVYTHCCYLLRYCCPSLGAISEGLGFGVKTSWALHALRADVQLFRGHSV